MKQFKTRTIPQSIFIIASLVTGATALADQEPNFTAINETLESISNNFAASSAEIRGVSLRFDPDQSSVTENRYRLEGSMTFVASPWNQQDVPTQFTISFQAIEPSQQAAEGLINAEGSFTMQTDALSYLKYKAQKADCQKSYANKAGIMRRLAEQDCQAAQKLAKVSSLSEAADTLREHISDHETALVNFIAGANADLARVQNTLVKQEIKQSIAKAEKYLEFVRAAKIENTKTGFRVQMDRAISILDFLTIQAVDFEASADSLRFNGTIQLSKGFAIYSLMKPELSRLLTGLETAQPSSTEQVQAHLRTLARLWATYKK